MQMSQTNILLRKLALQALYASTPIATDSLSLTYSAIPLPLGLLEEQLALVGDEPGPPRPARRLRPRRRRVEVSRALQDFQHKVAAWECCGIDFIWNISSLSIMYCSSLFDDEVSSQDTSRKKIW